MGGVWKGRKEGRKREGNKGMNKGEGEEGRKREGNKGMNRKIIREEYRIGRAQSRVCDRGKDRETKEGWSSKGRTEGRGRGAPLHRKLG